MTSVAYTPNTTRDTILAKLNDLEKEHCVTILFACEVGSRAWGLESPTSDYDVKFIYVRRLKWYLGLEEDKRDIIDDNSDFDTNGWDLRKALQLLRESNCGILEWLNSTPINRYREAPRFLEHAQQIAVTSHCRRSLLLAYWGKAGKHYREYILVENAAGYVTLKKYLFVLQAILNARWILTFSPKGVDLPPQDFSQLLESFTNTQNELPSDIYQDTQRLMQEKRAGTLKDGKRLKNLDKWIVVELTKLEETCKKYERKDRAEIAIFNDMFSEFVLEASGYKLVEGKGV